MQGPCLGPGNRKPLIIGGAIIGGIWLLNSTYRDGFMDGLVATGKGGAVHYAGGGFPWGLLIIGAIIYFFWKKGSFERHNRGPWGPGRGGPFSPAPYSQGGPNGQPGLDPRAFMTPEGRAQFDQQRAAWAQQAQAQQAQQAQGQPFRGPRAFFDDWHQQAHEQGGQPGAQPGGFTGPVAPPPFTGGPMTPPPPPTPDYWAGVNRAEGAAKAQGPTGGPAGATGFSGATGVSGATSPAGATGAAGSPPEQW